MAEPLLTVHGLRGGYGGTPVLQGVDLDVPTGEIVAVIGRNGVGKTTLLRTLMGLLPASAGTVRLRGVDLGPLAAHRRARLGIGYVPQGRDVLPRMTVEENLRVGERIRGRAAAADYAAVYDLFPILQERRQQRAGTLSGGQQQQLAIGRVLVGRPDLILLDEPSEGIQPNVVQEIGRIAVALNRRTGVTIVLVEQNIDLIRATAGRCYVMDKGRITAELPPEALADRATVRRHLAM